MPAWNWEGLQAEGCPSNISLEVMCRGSRTWESLEDTLLESVSLGCSLMSRPGRSNHRWQSVRRNAAGFYFVLFGILSR